jgi:N-methylhydantoinase A
MEEMKFHVGSDVGGTFTDIWVQASSGQTRVFKAPTSQDTISGIVEALEMAAVSYAMGFSEFLSRVERFCHGSTVGLNALLTGNAARTIIVTTDGFRDTLEIGRMRRQFAGLSELEVTDAYLRGRWPALIDRNSVIEVTERIDYKGTVIQALDIERARKQIRSAAKGLPESVAICTLWSTTNPDHEKRLKDIVREEMPEAYVCASHEVSPVVGEHIRMSTTAVNAALGPVLSRYLEGLDKMINASGLNSPLLVMTGAGGVVSGDFAAQLPASVLFSGPTAGVVGCLGLANKLGRENALTIDVGGTSFDVGLIVKSRPLMRSETRVVGVEIELPSVDVSSIGAGGGSIARTRFGNLTVGPQSAGANPGPACYGRGGIEPTATDADLILGTLDPNYFLGGRMRLDHDAAARAIEDHIAKPLRLSLLEAAWGIRKVFESRMADLLRRVTIERGYDPRDFTLFACGGSGPSHAWSLCKEIGAREFIVPAMATAQSAFGTGTCDLRHTSQYPLSIRIPAEIKMTSEQLLELGDGFDKVKKEVSHALSQDQIPYKAINVERSLGLRYLGQTHQLDVDYPDSEITEASFSECLDRFEGLYESLFGKGSGFRQAGFEVSYVRALGTGILEAPSNPSMGEPLKHVGSRKVFFDNPKQPLDTDIYTVEYPAKDEAVEGPSVIEFPGHTLLVPPGGRAESDELANFKVRI